MPNQTVLVLDFGGQYKELIARRVRECQVYSLILPGDTPPQEIQALAPIGIILTGGPASVYLPDAPLPDPALFRLGIPILGICYGMQLICQMCGGVVAPGARKEYGVIEATLDPAAPLFGDISPRQPVLMSHTDQVQSLPAGFVADGHTASCPVAAMHHPDRRIYGVQFHPEVAHTACGMDIFRHFLFDVCGAAGDYTMADFIERQAAAIRQTVGSGRILLGLSGGVDSSVAAALLAHAVPGQLVCVFVDHGLMRKDEGDEIEAVFAHRQLHFIRVDAETRFLTALAGVADPEEKRRIIGRAFLEVFEAEAHKLGDIPFFAQGTIYPDVVESGFKGSATIKSHHNVGGLPARIHFDGIVEPLRYLFKDEVRALGRQLGLPAALVERQPFPGPGLAVRIIGEITAEKLQMLREADAIFRQEMRRVRRKPDQYFAVLTDLRSVGVMGDGRTYDYTLALRAVNTSDFMTAEYARLPYGVLDRTSARIVNEVPGINRVVYDITGKPPATIEWE